MKKPNTKSGIFLALAILVLVAIGAWFFWDRSPSPAGPAGPSKGAVQEDEASRLVAKMSPEVKIGQLMMIGLAGTTIDDQGQRQLEYCHAGNVILFDRNMDTPEQVQHLTKKNRHDDPQEERRHAFHCPRSGRGPSPAHAQGLPARTV